MFGTPSPLRDLTGTGAPRWRQRALYDFMKDLAPLHERGAVARIAIWDTIPGSDMTLLDALKGTSASAANGIAQIVKTRAYGDGHAASA